MSDHTAAEASGSGTGMGIGIGMGNSTLSSIGPIRMGQREVKSCNYCYKRKVKCDKTFPCSRCVSRGLADLCEQQTVMVNGKVIGGGRMPSTKTPTLAQLAEENKALHRRINAQEKTIHALLDKYRIDQQAETNELDAKQALLATVSLDVGEHEAKSIYTSDEIAPATDISREDGEMSEAGSSGTGRSRSRRQSLEYEQEQEVEELEKVNYMSHVNQIYGMDARKDKDAGEGLIHISSYIGAITLDTLFSMVPVNCSSRLVKFHCDRLHWIHTVFHEPTFMQEHDEWINSMINQTPIAKSYDFYALYYAIIACSLYFMEEMEAELMGFSTGTTRFLFDTSVNCLQLSNFMVNPTIPVLQTICILPMIAHAFDGSKYLGSLMHCALGLARDLDFHLLTASTRPEKFGGNVQSELVRRIWWCLTVTDSLRPEAHHPFHLCLPTARTSAPANIDDRELDNARQVISRPLSETTRVTHLLAIGRLAALFRDFNQSFSTKTTMKDRFKCVQDHDLRLQHLLDDILDLRPREEETYLPPEFVDGPFDYRPWSRYLWSTSLPPSRIMLYRWFLGKSYTDTRWKQAREVCLQAARDTLKAWRKPVPSLFQKNWHVSSYTVIAGMVIALELINGGHEGTSWDSLRVEVLSVIELFKSLTTTKNAIITRGIALLEGMITEAEARLSTAIPEHGQEAAEAGSGIEASGDAMFQQNPTMNQPFDFTMDGFWPQGMLDHWDNDLLNIFFQPDFNTT
ncbi:uncharacterized protein I303_104844 [Kwoniella dejecticola CBS 10117]|uniref:Zn(2)-C6 fungal-type domain-containing protein n=1 Tax=Kwoniella dejecticola CBS 10117 TaxID=1296121 RepID=A0A1A6A469_9TREE|nr:uncharacterized protein I303_04174 [Kwoniella dejecticola CBS 10117]OBR84853.1 hypothetical protein I303_04174 [Kwoniella dejecticola CBS 10117]